MSPKNTFLKVTDFESGTDVQVYITTVRKLLPKYYVFRQERGLE